MHCDTSLENLWGINKVTIAILGAGYIGAALAGQLTKSGYEVTATTTSRERESELNKVAQQVWVMRGDDKKRMKDLVEQHEILVLTMAPKDRSPQQYEKTYLDTVKSLINALREGSKVKKILYTSSTSVYKEKEGGEVTELSPLKKDHLLVQVEKTLQEEVPHEISLQILRLGGITGPGREIAQRAKRFEQGPVAGTGEEYTNSVHRDDVVGALSWLIEKQFQETEIYNLCCDTHPRRKELYGRYVKGGISWDSTKPQVYGGNKRVSSEKIKGAGYEIRHRKIF